jgi:hypothetical protein
MVEHRVAAIEHRGSLDPAVRSKVQNLPAFKNLPPAGVVRRLWKWQAEAMAELHRKGVCIFRAVLGAAHQLVRPATSKAVGSSGHSVHRIKFCVQFARCQGRQISLVPPPPGVPP